MYSYNFYNTLKVEVLLRLQERNFYYKYIQKKLPVCLLNWQLTPKASVHNFKTRRTTDLHTSRSKHEFKKKYKLPHVIKNILELVIDKIVTHNLRGFSSYVKLRMSVTQFMQVQFNFSICKLTLMLTRV